MLTEAKTSVYKIKPQALDVSLTLYWKGHSLWSSCLSVVPDKGPHQSLASSKL